jgi:hypothetical protein
MFRYNRKIISSTGRIMNKESSNDYVEVESLLPYYLLFNSHRISEKVSHALQIIFVTQKHARIYILDQIAYVIKEVKLENLDTPKRIMSLYYHIDMMLKIWKDILNTQAEIDFLKAQNEYSDEKANMRDLEIVLRLIETLCICNLYTESLNLKKISSSILKSCYELLTVISDQNKINPYYCVFSKVVPLRKLIMVNKIESEDSFKELFSKETLFFDLILAKGFDKFYEIFQDKGMVLLIYLTEWIRTWINTIK